MTKGKLCRSTDDKLYIGLTLVVTDPNNFNPCEVIEYGTVSNVLNKPVCFSLPDNVRNVEVIYDNILKPFSDSKIFDKFQESFDWFRCINKFVSFDKLFMYVLKQKYDKDYSKFMELCKSNVDRIDWNVKDSEGNTMLHYVTIMNKYPEIACDIIRHIKGRENYTNLFNTTNNRGVVPLATVLHDNFICNNTKEANTDIIRGLFDAGANLLLKSKNTDNYVWEGKYDLMFCVLKQDPGTLLVASKFTTKTNYGTYKICCSLKEPPECQLYSIANLITDLPKNLLERVLKFPCIQIHKILLTNKHCSLTSKMSDGTPCMHYFVEYGNKELVKFMFYQGLESSYLLDTSNNSILHTAICKRKTDNAVVIMKRCSGKTLRVMLETQNFSKETPLDLAIKKELFSLITSLNHYRPEIFMEIFSTFDSAGNYWFHRAVRDKSKEFLKVLTEQENLASYIDSENAKQHTPLMLSVRHKFVEGFKILKDTQKCRIDVNDTEGYTLLHLAIIYYEKEIFLELLQVIVSDNQLRQIIGRPVKIPAIRSIPSTQNDGLTPLLLSLRCQQFVAARLLLENGANINTLDCEGRTFNSYLIETCRDENELDSFTKKVDCIHNDVSSLSLSVQYSNESVFDLLITKCDLDMIACQDDSQNTVLSLILSNVKYTRFLKPLLSRLDVFYRDETKKAKLSQIIDKQNKKGETPLTLSIISGNPESVGKLLDLGCDVNKDKVAILLNLAIEHGERTFQTVFEHFRKKDDQFLKNCLEIHPPEIPHCVIHSINHANLLALRTLIVYNEIYKNIIHGNLPLLHYAITKQFVEGVKYLIFLGLPLATHNSEQILTLHSVTLKLRLIFTESKIGYKLGSGYVLTDIPNLERTEYCSDITEVRNISVLFQNLVECKISELLQQYISIHTSSLPSYIAQLSMISSKYATLQLMEYLLNSNNAQKCIFDVNSTESDGNTVVHNGIYNPCIQSFVLLLDHLDTINTDGWFFAGTKHIDRLNNQKHSPLELSMKEYKKEAFLTLRQHGASYSTKGSGQNILHRYITCKITDISYLDLILEDLSQQKSEIINEYNSTGYTPLHTAVIAGNTLVYSKLMALTLCNYDVASKPERNNIVHLAIQKNSPELLKLILEDLKDREKDKNDENRLINRENAKQLTPQFLAVEEGNIDLILNMPELFGVSADGINLLHHAVKCSDKSPKHLEMIKTIITKKEGMVNVGDKYNETPLLYAVKLPRESALRKLLECPSIDFSCKNHNGMTALHLAIHSSPNVLKLLLNAIDKRPSKIINIQDKEGKTALHHCIESIVYNKDILNLLFARNPDLQLVDSKSNNILHCAANCKVELLKALITHIKDKSPSIIIYLLSQQNKENNTPLQCAIQMKNIPCVVVFLKINATLPVIQVDGTVTLCNRQPYPHTKVPMCLYDVKLKDKPDLHICVGFKLSDKQWILSDLPKLSCTYLTPLIHNHSQYQHVSSQLPRVSKIPNDSIDESLLKLNLLSCHCYEPLELVIDSLKDRKFINGARLMHLAASCGTIQIIEYLIELYGAGIPFSDLDKKGYSIIHYSIENKETHILRILCERMKRDHPQDFFELSGKLLQFCITENDFEAFKILLEKQYSGNAAYTDTHGDTLLHLIVLHSRNVDYVRELLKCPQLIASEFCNNVNKNSNTALHLLTEQENLASYIDSENAKQHTPLMLSVRHKFVEGFKILKDTQKCRIDVNDTEGYTLLHLAIIYYEKEIFLELLQVIVSDNQLRQIIGRPVKIPAIRSIPSTQYHGLTPLLLSLRCQQFVAARLLLENGAKINTLDCEGRTFNSYLIETCRDENELDFFTKKVDCIHNDVSSLSLSVQYSNEAVFDLLITKCDLDMIAYQDDSQNTVLSLILSDEKDTRFLKQLLSRLDVFYRDETKRTKLNQIIDKQNKKGETPLTLSIISGNTETVSKLLALGCNVTKDKVATLLNLAIKHGERTFQTVFKHFRKKDDQFLKDCLEIRPPEIPHCVIHSINHTNLLALTTLIEYNESYKKIIHGNLPLLHYAMTKQFVEGVKYLISLGLPLATHNSEQILTLHSDTLKLRLVFTESKVGYKLGSGYVLTDIPNLVRTEYCSDITEVMNISVLFQNLVECKISEPLQQYISIHTSSLHSYTAQLSIISSKYATLQIMEYLLNSKNAQKCVFNVNATESDGNTVVHNGIYNPCIQSFALLLDHLDTINTQGWILAATKHIDRLNNQRYSPLELSMKENKKEAFLTLRQHGASYATKGSGQNILHRYITCNITDISYLDLILEDLSQQNSEIINEYNSTGYTPLHTAVSAGNTLVYSKLMTLTSCNYDIVSKFEGNNIVHLVIQIINPELLKLILEDLKNREKDTKDENRLINRENAKQLTPQFLAVEEGNIDLILNMPELSGVSADGINLLHHAVKCSDKSPKHLEMIKTIMTKKEGMLNAGDKFNETPLHYAVKLSRESALRKLLECPSIDFSCQNNNGQTALHLAIHNNTNILKLLLNAIDKQ